MFATMNSKAKKKKKRRNQTKRRDMPSRSASRSDRLEQMGNQTKLRSTVPTRVLDI